MGVILVLEISPLRIGGQFAFFLQKVALVMRALFGVECDSEGLSESVPGTGTRRERIYVLLG
ncbi:MAG: hypothetical protein KAY37_14700 [Phycisphaerae bacterium]|nr:hypothetical protein [Phycisphaerae bacterium]